MSDFRDFFKKRNGRNWPSIGEARPEPDTWEGLIMETVADYLDWRLPKKDDPDDLERA